MEFKQRPSGPVADRVTPQSDNLSACWELRSYSLPHVKGVASVRNTSTLALGSQMSLNGVLRQIIQIAATSNTIELLSTRLARALGEAFQADGCIVVSFKVPFQYADMSCWVGKQDIVPIVCSPSGHSFLMQRSLHVQPPTSGASGGGVNSEASIVGTAESIWQHLQMPLPLPSTVSVLEISIQFQGVPNGVISLVRSQSHPWTTAEVEGLELFSQQIATAFSHLQLQQLIEQQVQYQGVVNRLAFAVRNTSELIDIFKLATEGTTQALQAKRGMLLRIRYADPLFRNRSPQEIPKARVIVVHEWTDPTAHVAWNSTLTEESANVLNQSFWLGECELFERAFQCSQALPIDNTKSLSEQEIPARLNELLGLERLNSLLITPLENQGTVLGFLVVQDSQPRSWQPADVDLLDLVSVQVSNAIIQTETLRQVQSLVDKRTAELQQSLTIQAKLYERTRQQVEQLRQLNQLKDEFLDTVSHELRTPLTSMALAIRMLRQIGIQGERGDRYLDILEQQCAQETNLINDLLALQELESKQIAIQLEEINLAEFTEDIAQSFRHRWAADGLSLHLEFPSHPVKIQSDRDSLHRILVELLTNAGKYSTPHRTIHLKLIHRREVPTNHIIFSITNTGSGISPEELPYIFEKFRRCQGATQNAIQGTGLGLALVKSLVQHLNGTISASSAPTENSQEWETCFSVILPQSFSITK